MKSALIVAHPDDESLFFGGLILSQPGNWTIVACSIPRIDPIRAWKFFSACELLGAKGQLFPFTEPQPTIRFPDSMLNHIHLEGYDRIVTHGVEGGYGHTQHVGLSEFIHRKWAHKEIWSDCPPDKSDYTEEIVLDEAKLANKYHAILCYDHKLPYEGVSMSKGAALIKRYCQDGGWNPGVERYRVQAASHRAD